MTEDMFWLLWSGGGLYWYLMGENWLLLDILRVYTGPLRDLHGPENHWHPRWGASSIGIFGTHLPRSWGAVELLWERDPNQVFSTGILTFIVSRLANSRRHIKGRQRAGDCSVNINPTVEAAHLWVLAPARILRACQIWVKEKEKRPSGCNPRCNFPVSTAL